MSPEVERSHFDDLGLAKTVNVIGKVLNIVHRFRQSAAAAVDRFSRCVADVSTWLSSSRLRLNPAKTVVIWLGGRQQVANIAVSNIPVLS